MVLALPLPLEGRWDLREAVVLVLHRQLSACAHRIRTDRTYQTC